MLVFIASAPDSRVYAQGGASGQKIIYDVYAGGIHAVEAKMDLDLESEERYSFSFFAKTRGFLGRLAPWNGTFFSKGWREGKDHFLPAQHKSIATWKGEQETQEYNFGKDGSFQSYSVTKNDNPRDEREIEASLTKDTIDVMTATLLTMQKIAQGGKCESKAEIFDGKRRFEIAFVDQGEDELPPSRYNVYSGKATQCTVAVKPLAGAWHKKPRGWLSIQEQGRELGTMPTVWFARMEEGQPALPVRVRVKTSYGTLFMHLSEYRNADKILIADKRVDD